VKPDPAPVVPGPLAAEFQAARGGSRDALGRLLELCRGYLLAVANKELESGLYAKAGASDLVQEAFLEAYRIFDRFQGEDLTELLPWLRAILLNKLSDLERLYRATAKRQINREQVLDAGADGALRAADPLTPSGQVANDEEARKLRAVLDRLPEHYRQVLVWRQWEELPFEEIARRLDKTADAARMLWWRALQRLQKDMGSPD
jgi:RNA polymerase sigma-70 factor (ECF subfamily)